MGRTIARLKSDLRPACPECTSKDVVFYGSGMFRLTPELVIVLTGEINHEPDGHVVCDCGWEGERRDLVVPPGGPEL